jgi:hypothetical protein
LPVRLNNRKYRSRSIRFTASSAGGEIGVAPLPRNLQARQEVSNQILAIGMAAP